MYDIYRYQPDAADFRLTLAARKSKWRHYTLRFASARAQHPAHQTARAELYLPHGDSPKPLAILLHGIGDFSLEPMKRAAARLAAQGIAGCALRMVFNSKRQPPEIKKRYPFLTAEEWIEHYVTSVTEVRQILDWAATNPEIDENRIALVGISLGGFIGAIAMGLDPRIGTGVLALMGGNSEKLVHRGRHITLHRVPRVTDTELAAMQARYAAYLARVRTQGFGQVAPNEPYYQTDPLTFAHRLKDRNLMLVNARWDEIVPRATTEDFWRAAGEPLIKWYAVNHVAFWLLAPWANHQLGCFLRQHLLDGG